MPYFQILKPQNVEEIGQTVTVVYMWYGSLANAIIEADSVETFMNKSASSTLVSFSRPLAFSSSRQCSFSKAQQRSHISFIPALLIFFGFLISKSPHKQRTTQLARFPSFGLSKTPTTKETTETSRPGR
jgi:hypothetical protein